MNRESSAARSLADRSLADHVVLALATGLGAGWTPVAPGTFGSLWGPLVAFGLQQTPLPVYCVAAVAIALVGVPICGRGAQLLGLEDPGPVVWDEIAAFPIVFFLIPVTWTTASLGFLLFRLFDVWKPWPAYRLEHLPGGWGIMADDLAAGLYARMCLGLILLALPASQ